MVNKLFWIIDVVVCYRLGDDEEEVKEEEKGSAG